MLTDLKVRQAKPKAKGYKIHDARGLYLYVTVHGAKSWRYDYVHAGKRKTLTLGLYDDVTLEEARAKHQTARTLVRTGADPLTVRKPHATADAAPVTFRAAGKAWYEGRRHSLAPLTRKRISGLLDRLTGALGDRPIKAITRADLLAVLTPLPPVTGRRAKQVASKVWQYAVGHGWTASDITAELAGTLAPAPPVKHHPAITDPSGVGAMLRAIDGMTDSLIGQAGLQLLALTFVRPGELRTAEWTEIDRDAAVWRIPAAKVKTRVDHLVPLSTQALAVLGRIQAITGSSRYVFPAVRSWSRPMSDGTLNAVLRRLGYGQDQMTAHGFRAIARTLLAEVLHVDPYVIEVQLAHAAPGPLGAAYNRARYLPQRTAMLQTWADYLDTLRASSR